MDWKDFDAGWVTDEVYTTSVICVEESEEKVHMVEIPKYAYDENVQFIRRLLSALMLYRQLNNGNLPKDLEDMCRLVQEVLDV